jgi:hypothetical protein
MGSNLGRVVYLTMGAIVFAQAPAATNTVGVVTKMDAAAKQIVLKTDAGTEVSVSMQPTASFRRVAPGETDLRNASTIAITDINTGDRVLARGKISDDQKSVAATLIVVMSQGDIAKKQASERADWDKRGVIGIVTAASATEVTINARAQGSAGTKPLAITAAQNAEIKRYSPESTKFSDAKTSTLGEIRPGDQLRALGDKNEDGTKMTATQIVSGAFREIAATVIAVDAGQNTIRVNDLATKKPIVVKITAESSLRKLEAQMAQRLASQNRPPEEGGGGRGDFPGGGRGNPPVGGGGGARGFGGPGGEGRGGGMRGSGDLSQMLDRVPKVTLADLKAGDAVIVLSSVASNDQMSVITLLAGVEPILTKPGTREMQLGSWSLGGVGGEQ